MQDHALLVPIAAAATVGDKACLARCCCMVLYGLVRGITSIFASSRSKASRKFCRFHFFESGGIMIGRTYVLPGKEGRKLIAIISESRSREQSTGLCEGERAAYTKYAPRASYRSAFRRGFFGEVKQRCSFLWWICVVQDVPYVSTAGETYLKYNTAPCTGITVRLPTNPTNPTTFHNIFSFFS